MHPHCFDNPKTYYRYTKRNDNLVKRFNIHERTSTYCIDVREEVQLTSRGTATTVATSKIIRKKTNRSKIHVDTNEPQHEISNNVVYAIWQSLRSACAYAQSDQSLC